ncbi:hypothetical protein A1O3_07195 [Capronia epimyces CBS 606.96]|uniref:Uncharacterized protein n=1 Tax=Capronia epimyces CBS 606.96 TaxID=1182542 RepID=W9XK83_9EURO|nr:uncharacterized protein A1O3_07195 [Capronia epimyces CBS 606.96]EXJ80907.1 hypothetical protein A1O3_07195 [Capronia epimyces CBS 606.96]
MSVDKVSSAGGGVTGSGLGSLTGALQGGVNNLINMGSTWLDRFFPAEKREQWKEWLTKFATERPYLASFLLSQVAMSGLPLALFALMTVTVFVFALLAGVLVGVLGALLFVVAAVGFALLILLPVLFFTTGAAVFIWLWAVAAYYIVKWFNQKDVPGIHTDVAGGLAKATGLSDLPGINGSALGAGDDNGNRDDNEHHDDNGSHDGNDDRHSQPQTHSTSKAHRAPAKLDKKDNSSTSTGAQHHSDAKDNSSTATATSTSTGAQHHSDTKEPSTTHQRKQAPRPSSTGHPSKVSDTVNGVAKTADGDGDGADGDATKTNGT